MVMGVMKISEVRGLVHKRVSLMGVVIQHGFPIRSKGTDKFLGLKIVDESHHEPLQVNIFAKNYPELPDVVALGDIIHLADVMMDIFNSEAIAVFAKSFSTFALYHLGDGGFVPYQSTPTYRLREVDKPFITSLRNWFPSFQLHEDSNAFTLVMDTMENVSINLVCKIIHVQEFGEDEWIAFVWDGTDTKPNKQYLWLEEEENPLPLHLEPSHLSRETLLKFPTVGSILRVVVFDQRIKKQAFQFLNTNIGKWMKLINVLCNCEVRAGLLQGVLTPSTKVRYAPEDDCLVSEREREFEARLRKTNQRISSWSIPWMSNCTGIDHKDSVFVTLMDVLTYPEVNAKFACVVRVVAMCPLMPKEFLTSCGIYRVRLTLEDSTARIHAFLFAEEAEKFWGGYPTAKILERKRDVLLGAETGVIARNPPWLQCCLKSYYVDESDIWGSRQFQIFDTKMI